jgi:hypothetical protein
VTQVSASKVGHEGFTKEQDHPASSGGDGRERRASVGTAAVAASVGTARPPPSASACVGGSRAVRRASRQRTSLQNRSGQMNLRAGGNGD